MSKINSIWRTFLSGLMLCFFFCFLISCSESPKKNIPFKNLASQKDTIRGKPSGSFSDTLVIGFPSAVFFNPDSLQMEKIKDISTKNAYETDVHNCYYQMRNARIVLKKYSSKIHIIETSVNRYLLFIKKDKSKTCIDLDSKGDMCGLFLFDGKKEPELADMMNIDTALGFYFEK